MTNVNLRIIGLLTATALGLTVLDASSSALAQGTKNTPRVGALWPDAPGPNPQRSALIRGLQETGYVEGNNIVIEDRYVGGDLNLFSAMAKDLATLNVDVIFAFGAAATEAARNATTQIPIVFFSLQNPVALGFVRTLAKRSGGNLTGATGFLPGMVGHRLELLKALQPGLHQVAVFSGTTSAPTSLEIGKSATALGLTLKLFLADHLAPTFKMIQIEHDEAISIMGEIPFLLQRQQIADLAAQTGLPAIYELREFVEAGGLMSYGPNLNELIREAAWDVGHILQGAHPNEIPIAQPTALELVVNLKAARALGLVVPPSILSQASEVLNPVDPQTVRAQGSQSTLKQPQTAGKKPR